MSVSSDMYVKAMREVVRGVETIYAAQKGTLLCSNSGMFVCACYITYSTNCRHLKDVVFIFIICYYMDGM